MVSSQLDFNVTGRYMDGSSVVAYQLVGTDGTQLRVNTARLIFMIGRGEIQNMRIQYNGDEVLPRGKGVNINKLPVYDINSCAFRGSDSSQAAASHSVKPSKTTNNNAMGQLTIQKRIMLKNICKGYLVTDLSGNERKLKREQVIDLATQKIISNATVTKYNPYSNLSKAEASKLPRYHETEYDHIQQYGPTLILRGVDCSLDKLPVLVVASDGTIVDPSDTNNNMLTMRSCLMHMNGVIYTPEKNLTFNNNDLIVVLPDGAVSTITHTDAIKNYTTNCNTTSATCDEYLDKLAEYKIEVYGNPIITLRADIVLKWAIIKRTGASSPTKHNQKSGGQA